MTRASYLAAALLAIASLTGCAEPARSPGPPGQTVILLENKVSGECELTWANARVDDRSLSLVTITPSGEKPATLDRQVLSPGEHTLAISASASCGKTDAPPAVLQVSQPVYMGREGGRITVSLSIRPDRGLAASFDIAGGQVLAPRADGGDVDCKSRLPADWAICRTEAALARAHQRRDVVLVLCLSEKLHEMRLLAATSSPPKAPSEAQDSALRDVETETTKRVLALANEAEYCIGDEKAAETGLFVEHVPLTEVYAAFR